MHLSCFKLNTWQQFYGHSLRAVMIVQAGCIDSLHEIDWKVHLTPKHNPLENNDFVVTFPILCGTKYPVLYNKTLLCFWKRKAGRLFLRKGKDGQHKYMRDNLCNQK